MISNKPIKKINEFTLYAKLADEKKYIKNKEERCKKAQDEFEKLDEEEKYYYEALNELKELGLPINMEATSFFADLIGYTKNIIDKNKNTIEGIKKIKELLLEIEIPYSNYHLYLSRELNDIGCKSFHEAIKNMLLYVKQTDESNPIAQCFIGDLDADDPTCQAEIGKLGFSIASSMSVKDENNEMPESIKEKVRIYSKNDY